MSLCKAVYTKYYPDNIMVDQNAETYIAKFTVQWFHLVSILKPDELEVSGEALKSSMR